MGMAFRENMMRGISDSEICHSFQEFCKKKKHNNGPVGGKEIGVKRKYLG